LYDGDTSVIHQSLKERHELLKKVVKPVKGRLEILVPDGGLNVHTPAGKKFYINLPSTYQVSLTLSDFCCHSFHFIFNGFFCFWLGI
jgi:hypothetical protein